MVMRYLPVWAIFLGIILLFFKGEGSFNAHFFHETKIQGEFISRRSNEFFFVPPPPLFVAQEPYAWERHYLGKPPKITKDFFRCKGNSLNPVHFDLETESSIRYHDCGGIDKHSLPLREGKEFIYPILIDLLNFLQDSLKKRVIITSGHRCPEHNTYVEVSKFNETSKHQIGAEVSFYVEGMEQRPEDVITLLMNYYQTTSKYKDDPSFQKFLRYEKPDTNVSTLPWYNKEIFIKLFKSHEGRNFDNRHSFPYLSIQVRYDTELQERVSYTWKGATQNYLRK